MAARSCMPTRRPARFGARSTKPAAAGASRSNSTSSTASRRAESRRASRTSWKVRIPTLHAVRYERCRIRRRTIRPSRPTRSSVASRSSNRKCSSMRGTWNSNRRRGCATRSTSCVTLNSDSQADRMHHAKICLASIAFFSLSTAAIAADTPQQHPYRYYVTGNAADVQRPTRGLFVLQGGGDDVDQNYSHMGKMAGGGDFVVLRASHAGEYNDYIYKLCNCDSVETLVI